MTTKILFYANHRSIEKKKFLIENKKQRQAKFAFNLYDSQGIIFDDSRTIFCFIILKLHFAPYLNRWCK